MRAKGIPRCHWGLILVLDTHDITHDDMIIPLKKNNKNINDDMNHHESTVSPKDSLVISVCFFPEAERELLKNPPETHDLSSK